HRVTILETAEADVARSNVGEPRKLFRHPHRVRVALANGDEHVLAVAVGLESQRLANREILGRRADARRAERLAVSALHVPRSISAIAMHAMPSPRPTKPSVSVVVALTFTQSAGMLRSAAMFATIAARCLPSRGASANTVRSTLPIRQPRSSS